MVKVRGLYGRAIASEVGEAEVIGHDDEDVGSFRREDGGDEREKKEEDVFHSELMDARSH